MTNNERIKKVEITADRYKALIAAEHELNALRYGGVDNWEWCWTAYNDYIQEYVDNHPLFLEHIGHTDYVLDDIWFNTIAEYETDMLLELIAEEEASTP